MAWYAELKRRQWYCINQFNAIYYYKKYLYEEWYNSLTDEQRQIVEENKRKRREKKEREAKEAIHRLLYMSNIISSLGDSYL